MIPRILTHNGRITVESPSGDYRTFQIRTQPKDAKFAAGERILSLLTGSDNNRDYTGFAFLKDDGRIIVWKRHRGTEVEQYVKLLLHPEHYEAKGVRYLVEEKCRVCNRTLTTPESIDAGIGPVCAGRI